MDLGSARVSRVGFGVAPKQAFERVPTRRVVTRALPRGDDVDSISSRSFGRSAFTEATADAPAFDWRYASSEGWSG
jgi:hypothetical protein